MPTTTVQDILANAKVKIQTKFPYLSQNDINNIYDQAVSDVLMLKFPYTQLTDLPETCIYEANWVYKRMVEIVEIDGISSMTGYSENGISKSLDNTYISNGLRSLIIPCCGTREE